MFNIFTILVKYVSMLTFANCSTKHEGEAGGNFIFNQSATCSAKLLLPILENNEYIDELMNFVPESQVNIKEFH